MVRKHKTPFIRTRTESCDEPSSCKPSKHVTDAVHKSTLVTVAKSHDVDTERGSNSVMTVLPSGFSPSNLHRLKSMVKPDNHNLKIGDLLVANGSRNDSNYLELGVRPTNRTPKNAIKPTLELANGSFFLNTMSASSPTSNIANETHKHIVMPNLELMNKSSFQNTTSTPIANTTKEPHKHIVMPTLEVANGNSFQNRVSTPIASTAMPNLELANESSLLNTMSTLTPISNITKEYNEHIIKSRNGSSFLNMVSTRIESLIKDDEIMPSGYANIEIKPELLNDGSMSSTNFITDSEMVHDNSDNKMIKTEPQEHNSHSSTEDEHGEMPTLCIENIFTTSLIDNQAIDDVNIPIKTEPHASEVIKTEYVELINEEPCLIDEESPFTIKTEVIKTEYVELMDEEPPFIKTEPFGVGECKLSVAGTSGIKMEPMDIKEGKPELEGQTKLLGWQVSKFSVLKSDSELGAAKADMMKTESMELVEGEFEVSGKELHTPTESMELNVHECRPKSEFNNVPAELIKSEPMEINVRETMVSKQESEISVKHESFNGDVTFTRINMKCIKNEPIDDVLNTNVAIVIKTEPIDNLLNTTGATFIKIEPPVDNVVNTCTGTNGAIIVKTESHDDFSDTNEEITDILPYNEDMLINGDSLVNESWRQTRSSGTKVTKTPPATVTKKNKTIKKSQIVTKNKKGTTRVCKTTKTQRLKNKYTHKIKQPLKNKNESSNLSSEKIKNKNGSSNLSSEKIKNKNESSKLSSEKIKNKNESSNLSSEKVKNKNGSSNLSSEKVKNKNESSNLSSEKIKNKNESRPRQEEKMEPQLESASTSTCDTLSERKPQNTQYRCVSCDASYCDNESCAAHIIDSHSSLDSSGKTKCDICQKLFHYSKVLFTHCLRKHIQLYIPAPRVNTKALDSINSSVSTNTTNSTNSSDSRVEIHNIDSNQSSAKGKVKTLKAPIIVHVSPKTAPICIAPPEEPMVTADGKVRKRRKYVKRVRTTIVTRHECVECDRWSPKKHFILKHLMCHTQRDNSSHRTRKVLCKICNFMCRNTPILKRHLLKNHILTKHPPSVMKKEKKAEEPKAAVKVYGEMPKRHIILRFRCLACGLLVRLKNELMSHIFTHVVKVSAGINKCGVCSVAFETDQMSHRHFRDNHTYMEVFASDKLIPGSVSANSSKLDPTLHTDQFNYYYECCQCSRGFVMRAAINKHMEGYAEESSRDPNIVCLCTICKKSISCETPFDLTDHMTVHFLTMACKQTLLFRKVRNASINAHLCMECGEVFSSCKKLTWHTKNKELGCQ